MATTVEQVETMLAEKVGDLKADIKGVSGEIQNLTTELRRDREARSVALIAHDALHADHELRIRQHDHDIGNALTRVSHVEATTVTPKQLWSVVLGAIAGAAGLATIIFGIIDRVTL